MYFIPNSRIKVHKTSTLMYYGFCIKNVWFIISCSLEKLLYLLFHLNISHFSLEQLLSLSPASPYHFLACVHFPNLTEIFRSFRNMLPFQASTVHSVNPSLWNASPPSFLFHLTTSKRPSRFSSDVIFSREPSTPLEWYAHSCACLSHRLVRPL